MPSQSSAAVYLLAIARPANRPIASHQRGLPPCEQPRQRPQAGGPEDQQRRVGRHQHAADAEQQRRVQQCRGTNAGPPARQQAICGVRQQQRGDRHRQRAQQPDAQRVRRRPAWCRGGSRARPSADGPDSRRPARATRPSNRPRPARAAAMRRRRGAAGSARQARPGAIGNAFSTRTLHRARQTSVAETA